MFRHLTVSVYIYRIFDMTQLSPIGSVFSSNTFLFGTMTYVTLKRFGKIIKFYQLSHLKFHSGVFFFNNSFVPLPVQLTELN